jgi:hypothetical protein
VAGDAADIGTVAGISADVTSVAGISSNVTTVAGISADVTTVAGISADVTTVAGISADVTVVADNIADINTKVPRTSATGAAVIPTGTEAQRDGTPLAGYFRFNSDTDKFEGYDGVEWGAVGGGGGFFKGENGAVGDATTGPGDIFRINEQELNTSVTISGTENASCTGPLAVASGVTLTVSAGGTLAVI